MPSTILPLSERSASGLPLGAQRPRICHFPEYVSSAGQEAIELARLAGLELDEWQQFVLLHSLGELADGKWAAQTVGLTVGRQNGKGSILEARELCGLFLLGEKLINHTAHQQKTATNHFKRMLRLIEGVPEFDRRVLKAPTGKGNEAIELRGGHEIFFATRKGGGGRGLTADLQVYDEAMYLTEQDRSSLAPTMAARSMAGNIQTWYVGSAVDEDDPAQDGIPFAQVRESGIAKAGGVAYFEWSAAGDDPSNVLEEVAADPDVWAQANPGLGIRISHKWVEHERTVEMGPRGFAVERLGIGAWPSPDIGNSVISAEKWGDGTDQESSAVDPVCFAYDVSPNRNWSAIGVAGVRADGLFHVEVIEHREGTGWVVQRVADLVAKHGAIAVKALGGSAGAAALIPALAGAGIEVSAANSSDFARGCGNFYDAVDQATLKHRGTAELRVAVKGATKRELPDGWVWSRKNSAVDISPLVACTLALGGLVDAGALSGGMEF